MVEEIFVREWLSSQTQKQPNQDTPISPPLGLPFFPAPPPKDNLPAIGAMVFELLESRSPPRKKWEEQGSGATRPLDSPVWWCQALALAKIQIVGVKGKNKQEERVKSAPWSVRDRHGSFYGA